MSASNIRLFWSVTHYRRLASKKLLFGIDKDMPKSFLVSFSTAIVFLLIATSNFLTVLPILVIVYSFLYIRFKINPYWLDRLALRSYFRKQFKDSYINKDIIKFIGR